MNEGIAIFLTDMHMVRGKALACCVLTRLAILLFTKVSKS